MNKYILAVMVGPSGAGKSTVANDITKKSNPLAQYFPQFMPGCIISTDEIRGQLTGNFVDQSRNNDVFKLAYKLLEVRMESRCPTIFDATNLNQRDRKKILSYLPEDETAIYIVVNRPMDEKIKTDDWRKNVNVKGVPLMEYHEKKFNDEIENIMNGDNDHRVYVVDSRINMGLNDDL